MDVRDRYPVQKLDELASQRVERKLVREGLDHDHETTVDGRKATTNHDHETTVDGREPEQLEQQLVPQTKRQVARSASETL